MTAPLIECVPNFSEGRDREVIRALGDAIEGVEGVWLLDVDAGRATNRTVMTFVGPPGPVLEAAVRAARVAAERIDMRVHKGEHPRFGALDVCPLVPVRGITMDEVAALARQLGARLGNEVGLTVYGYEHAASAPERRNLADVRAGEYEGLEEKLSRPEWRPDYGPATFNPRSGATAVGARGLLVAYNVNLNTTSTRRANAVAFDVRERGRVKLDPATGRAVVDARGEPVHVPGSLRAVKAIGWYLEDYGVAQVSMNLTDLSVTPLHVAFEECVRRADARGVRVTGSELVGVVPLAAMLEAGRYFLRKQRRSTGVSDRELVHIAARSLGLGEVAPFKPEEKIIEYAIAARTREGARSLVAMPFERFAEETASEAPAPGGGSVSAAVGALGAALGTMVANLSSHKRGWDERWEEFSEWAEQGKACYTELLRLVDADTDAFNAVLAAMRLPRATDAERAARADAIEAATRGAIEVPLRVMEVSVAALAVTRAMVERGLASSVSDAAVGALCARTAAAGAHLNVRINAVGLRDRRVAEEVVARGAALERDARDREREVLAAVEARLGTTG